MTIIDVHTHFLPEAYLDTLAELDQPVGVEYHDGERFLSIPHGTIPMPDGFTDVEERIRWMDGNGIDKTAISISTPNPNEAPFSVGESTQLVRNLNDGFAAVRSAHPDRFLAMGAIPFRDPEEALAELDRITGDLGLDGVTLPTSVRDRILSDPEFAPIFERLDELNLPAFMHPRRNALSDEMKRTEEYMNPLAIFPSETTIQVCRLLFNGFFDTYDFPLIVAHLGGTLPYLAGRLERGRRVYSGPDEPPERPVMDHLSDFYYDSISFHPPAIRAAIETVGVDRLVLGTDYPFVVGDFDETASSIEAAVPDEADREMVYGETAEQLFS